MHHDRDPVFTSYAWTARQLLDDAMRLSYALRGAKDNAEMEAFNSRFKAEGHSLFLEAQTLIDLIAVVDMRMVYYTTEPSVWRSQKASCGSGSGATPATIRYYRDTSVAPQPCSVQVTRNFGIGLLHSPNPARVATWRAFEVPWTRFVKSSNGRCAGGNDAALYDNCTTFQNPILSGEPLTCQVQEPLERIHEHNRRARI